MLLFIDDYQLLQYSKNSSLFSMDWKKASSRLSYKKVAKRFMSVAFLIRKHKPQIMLANFEDMVYKQIWGEEQLFYHKIHKVLLDAGVKKFAYIKSKDEITKILFDQLLFNPELNKVEIKSFDTRDDAISWLMSDPKIKELKEKFAISA